MTQDRAGAIVTRDHRGTVVTYPAPQGEALSTDYVVTVNGQPVDVYTARVNDPPFDHLDYGGTYSFVQFDFDGRATIRVHSPGDLALQSAPDLGPVDEGLPVEERLEGRYMQGARIRPLSKGIRHALVDENTTTLNLDEPCQLAFEPGGYTTSDGKRRPLLILANPLEVDPPEEDDPNVIYYGPGIHRPEGGVVEVKSGQTLYIAGGAVVQAAIVVRDAEGVTIRGRGILCGNAWPHLKGPQRWLVNLVGSRNVTVEGIVLRGSYAWTLVPCNCDHVAIRNVKICGGRVFNDDGINPCNSRHVTIRDCFIRSDDDCLALKGLEREWGDVADIRVECCVLWCDRARVTLLGHESRAPHMRDILYRDIDVLHYVQKIFLLEPGEEMILENVRFENWRIHGEGQKMLAVIRPTLNRYMRTRSAGHIRAVRFQDIKISGQPGKCQVVVEGYDAEHQAVDVSFDNVRILGEPLSRESPNVRLGSDAFIDGITFKS